MSQLIHNSIPSCSEENPGSVLDISMKKQNKVKNDDLYRRVLVENTVRSIQVEVNRKIKEAFMFF
jgi:hypothetical protein